MSSSDDKEKFLRKNEELASDFDDFLKKLATVILCFSFS